MEEGWLREGGVGRASVDSSPPEYFPGFMIWSKFWMSSSLNKLFFSVSYDFLGLTVNKNLRYLFGFSLSEYTILLTFSSMKFFFHKFRNY